MFALPHEEMANSQCGFTSQLQLMLAIGHRGLERCHETNIKTAYCAAEASAIHTNLNASSVFTLRQCSIVHHLYTRIYEKKK